MSTFGIVLLCLIVFAVGAVGALLTVGWYITQKYKGRMKKRPASTDEKEKKSIGTMNLILVIIGIMLLTFTISMIRLFREYGAVPDTLITCVFAAIASECGIMGWIKTTKDRKRERKWELEDRKEREKKKVDHDGTDRSNQ